MLFTKGIVRKTFLFSALLITLVTLISFGILYFAMPGHYLHSKERTFQRNLNVLVTQLQSAASHDEYAGMLFDFSANNNAVVFSLDENDELLPAASTPFLSMHEERGVVFVSTGDMRLVMPEQRISILIGDGPQGSQATIRQHPERVGMMRALSPASANALTIRKHVGGPVAEYIIATTTLQPIDEARGVLLSLAPYIILGGIAIGLVFAWIYARQMTGPILQISGATRRMQLMEPDASSDVRSEDELGLLSQNLDNLYASLLANIEALGSERDKATALERSKTEMLQSASHELKTPIAALRGIMEGMADNVGVYKDKEKYIAVCIKETDKLSLLVDEILDASKSDATLDELDIREIPLAAVIDELLEQHAISISEKNLKVTRDISPVNIFTDSVVLGRALSNIISNAVRYAPDGGEIRLALYEGCLIIENQCEPIPEDELDRFFEPFYTRSQSRDKSKSGTGLGLYITKRSLERLGMTYQAENGERGFRLTINLHTENMPAT